MSHGICFHSDSMSLALFLLHSNSIKFSQFTVGKSSVKYRHSVPLVVSGMNETNVISSVCVSAVYA